MPFLGKWSGGLTVDRVGPKAIGSPKENGLKGFLQLYRTGDRFELHLDGAQFSLVSGGTWSHKNGQVILTPKEVKIDDGGGWEARDPNRPWVDPAELREGYSRPMALNLSTDGQRLTGLLVSVGPLTGTHSFLREGFGR